MVKVGQGTIQYKGYKGGGGSVTKNSDQVRAQWQLVHVDNTHLHGPMACPHLSLLRVRVASHSGGSQVLRLRLPGRVGGGVCSNLCTWEHTYQYSALHSRRTLFTNTLDLHSALTSPALTCPFSMHDLCAPTPCPVMTCPHLSLFLSPDGSSSGGSSSVGGSGSGGVLGLLLCTWEHTDQYIAREGEVGQGRAGYDTIQGIQGRGRISNKKLRSGQGSMAARSR